MGRIRWRRSEVVRGFCEGGIDGVFREGVMEEVIR